MRVIPFSVPLVLVASLTAAQPLLRNGDFAAEGEGWRIRLDGAPGQVRFVDDGKGGRCAQFHKTGATSDWSCVGLTQAVTLDGDADYALSLRYRAILKEGIVGHACRVFLSRGEVKENRSLPASAEWTRFAWQFHSGPQRTKLSIQVALTYSSGDLWVDDLVLRKVGGSVEAEDFTDRQQARLASGHGLSAGRGVELTGAASVSTSLTLPAGTWRLRVIGEGAAGDDGLTRRAVRVRLEGRSELVDLHRQGTAHHGRLAFFETRRTGSHTLSVSRAQGYQGPLVFDRLTWVAHNGPAQVRPLALETQLVVAGKPNAVLVVGASPAMQEAGHRLQAALEEKVGVRLPVVNDAAWLAGEYVSKHAVVVGNLLQNKLAERLYCLWYTFEDCWYPGRGGWVVRTVHDPWGSGKNVVVLAGSDEAGTAAAVEQFIALVKPGRSVTLGQTLKVKMAPEVEEGVRRACGTPDPEYAKRVLDRRSQRSLMSSAARVGMSYARSGDPNRARMLVVYLLEHKRRPELGHDTHMELWKTIRAWDNVEECPAITDDERLEITNYLLHVLRSPEGVFNSMFVGSLGRSTVRHNHHMLAAMDAYYGGQYFRKYYALPEADDWLAKARFCFASQELQDKGQDESGNYEMSTALRPLLPYAYTEPGYRFLSSGAAKRFLDRCCLSIDNRYSLSGHGDCWEVDCFAPLALGIGAWYYHDGGYQYLLEERFRTHPSERDGMQIQPPFRLDGALQPQRPARFEGVVVAPLSQGHDDLYRNTGDLKWNVSREQAFDKLCLRTRFEPDAQYLLLDGIACGAHGHRDANCLVRFTDNDRVWLVDDSYTEGPFLSDHNGVVVTRDGLAEPLPACARLDAAADLGEVGLVRTTLPDHTGVDWERNLFWVKEKCVVVLDRLTALKPGNYGFRCLWRTLGAASLEGNRLVTRQEASTPERKDAFHLVSGGVRTTFREDREDFGSRWKGKYPFAPPVVNLESQDAARALAPGESFTFANLFYATNLHEPCHFDLAKLDERSALVSGEERFIVGVADGGWTLGEVKLVSGPFLLRHTQLDAALATALTVEGIAVTSAAEPFELHLDLARSKLLLQADSDRTVTVLGSVRRLAMGATSVDLSPLRRQDFNTELAAGQQAARAAQRAETPAPMHTSSNVGVVWRFHAGDTVSALARDGERLVVGSNAGEGLLLDDRGREQWRIKAQGKINAVTVGDLEGDGRNDYVFASEDTHVYAVDPDGKELWRFKCPAYPKRGGKLGQARDVLASDLDGDGKAEVIVGANNIELHILNGRGEQLRSFHGEDPKMTFNNFSTLDAEGDGKKTLFAFPSSGSFGYGWEFTLDGRVERFSTDGWPSHIRDRAEVDLDGDGKLDLACATNRGNLYYRLQRDGSLTNEKKFSLGVPATAMAGLSRQGAPGLLAVGIEASYVHLFDGAGQLLWSRPTNSPVTDLTFGHLHSRNVLAVGTLEGAVLFFDHAGKQLGLFAAAAPVSHLVAVPGGIAAAVGNEVVRLNSR